jgi:iron complex transport system substrate-binding protein
MPPYQRIASLLASGTEILYALGLGEQVVAISHECDFPLEAADKPRVTVSHVAAHATSGQIDQQVRDRLADGAALYGIDAAMLVALRPNLIVTQAQCDVCAVKYADVLDLIRSEPRLRAAQVVALNPNSVEDIFSDIQRVGEATGRPAAAQHYVSELQGRIAAVRARTDPLPQARRPRVACLEWLDPLMLAANWMPQLIEWAGGQQPLIDAAGKHSTCTDWRTIVDYDPQVMVIMPCGFDLPRAVREAGLLRKLPGVGELSAVRAGLVVAVDGNAYFNRSGPRIVDSLEILARVLHPELFGPPSTDDAQPVLESIQVPMMHPENPP